MTEDAEDDFRSWMYTVSGQTVHGPSHREAYFAGRNSMSTKIKQQEIQINKLLEEIAYLKSLSEQS